MVVKTIKAVGLLSGGLDSTLAARLMLEQGIEVHAINFTSPFCTCTPKKSGCAAVVTAVRNLGNISLKRVGLTDEYLEIVKNPKHGYGSGLNPCLDCRILKIKEAGKYMTEIGGSFLFTGEVLGQRPMSQHRPSLDLIDRESGLDGYILRPLSAAHLRPTNPEQRGYVDRSKMMDISGRSRKKQIEGAAQKGIMDFPCPAGGCLLTDKHFAGLMRDYFAFTEHPSIKDIPLLKIGRHFRLDTGDKVIVARDEHECLSFKRLCDEMHHLLTPLDFSGPSVILQGSSLNSAIRKMIEYTKRPFQNKNRISHLHHGELRILTFEEFGKG